MSDAIKVDYCPRCEKPVHASESNDDGVCGDCAKPLELVSLVVGSGFLQVGAAMIARDRAELVKELAEGIEEVIKHNAATSAGILAIVKQRLADLVQSAHALEEQAEGFLPGLEEEG